MDPVMKIFMHEAIDLLEQLESLGLDLEENPSSTDLLGELMRKTHTLKGSAGTAGLDEISSLAHRIEDLAELLRVGKVTATPEYFDILSQSFDVLGRTLEADREGRLQVEEVLEMDVVLEAWCAQVNGEGDREQETEETSDLGLGEYDFIRIDALEKKGKAIIRLEMDVRLSEEESLIEAEGIFKKVRGFSEIVFSEPPEWELERLVQDSHLKMILGTDLDEGQVFESLEGVPADNLQVSLFEQDKKKDADSGPDVSRTFVTEHTVRVETKELDDLLRLTGELVTHRARFQAIAAEIRQGLGDTVSGLDVEETAARLGYIASELQSGIMRARMVPVTRLFRALKRRVRRAARDFGGVARLSTAGEKTEMDKGVVDYLTAPLGDLMAVLASAVEEEGASGGPTQIHIRAEGKGNQVELHIESSRAVPDRERLAEVEEALLLSGWRLESRVAEDHFFCRLILPTTLAIVSVMMVEVGDEIYALPIEAVKETLRLRQQQIETVSGKTITELRGEALSVAFLRDVLDVPCAENDGDMFAVVVQNGSAPIGFVVDRLLGKQDVVIKPLSRRFSVVREVDGSAILGDGRVALVLNPGQLCKQEGIRAA